MNSKPCKPDLASFDISAETGFIPSKVPLARLPTYFQQWEDVVGQLAHLLKEKRLRQAVHQLPQIEFSEQTLHSVEEWRRALVMLSGLFQGYLWQEGKAGIPNKMPAVLAVPMCTVSKRIGVPPFITYASSNLYNWGLRDPTKPLSGDNLYALVNHTGTEDESWFFVVGVLLELEAVPAINAIFDGISARVERNNVQIINNLALIESSLVSMQRAINRMYERCDPTIFYVRIRPFLAGSKGLDAFPQGLVYEGVDTKPQQFSGGSGAQAATFQAIDGFLGNKPKGATEEFLKDMRKYMPTKHRKFVEYISSQPSLRDYVVNTGDLELITQYNATVDAFVNYRSNHIILVTRYVVIQKVNSVISTLEMNGTGGTHFMEFLKNLRDDTKALKIYL